jgi:hypothetical protein
VQQSLRAAYGNPDITWIVDPIAYHPKPEDNAGLIECFWSPRGVSIAIEDFEAGMVRRGLR